MTTNKKNLLFTQIDFRGVSLDVDAVLEQGEITYLHCEKSEERSQVGDIYIAKVINVVPTIQAAFVKLQSDQKAFLPLDHGTKFHYTKKVGNPDRLNQGDELLVQVVADPLKTKDTKVSGDLSLQTDHVVLTSGDPKKGASKKLPKNERERLKTFLQEFEEEPFGLILRTNCKGVELEVLRREIQQLKEQLIQLLGRGEHGSVYAKLYAGNTHRMALCKRFASGTLGEIVTDVSDFKEELQDAFPEQLHFYEEMPQLSKLYSIEEIIEKCFHKRVWLKHGGYLIVEETEAMNVVDVNSGKDTRKKPTPDEVLRINKEAADELTKQMRMRELSGIILVDFINMPNQEHRKELLRYLRSITKDDFNIVKVLDFTKLGLVEITREKKYPSLKQLLTE